jgi:stage V sporulation protein G
MTRILRRLQLNASYFEKNRRKCFRNSTFVPIKWLRQACSFADGLNLQQGVLHMEITEVNVYPVNEERLKAYVSITIDGCFVVRDLKVIRGNNGLFVAMPSKKRKDGQFKDIAHPLNQETREMIERAVFDAYENAVKSMGDSLSSLKSGSYDEE